MDGYNGYNETQRYAIIPAIKAALLEKASVLAALSCGLCGDPDRPAGEFHSEDYSQPFLLEPPATYAICKHCHSRLHKRFNRPEWEWQLFLWHVARGGYGREFVQMFPAQTRHGAFEALQDAGTALPYLRDRACSDDWWQSLSLDPETRDAPWARPRPLLPRPNAAQFRALLSGIDLSETERAILRFHATAAKRTVTMRAIAQEVLGRDRPAEANLAYGKLSRRLCEASGWQPDTREDRSPIWMSVTSEGWQPPPGASGKREFEWVMVLTLSEAVVGDIRSA